MSIKSGIISQYHASLAMLQQVVADCPPELWDSPDHKNRCWNVAAHALFYAHFYLHPSAQEFKPWTGIHLDGRILDHDIEGEDRQIASQADILDFIEFLEGQVNPMVEALDLDAESGFDWLPFNKLELQLYNIRHIMLHTGELAERLWQSAGIEARWVGKGK
ncbi:MAG: hypothetical protein JW757_09705 [Anaerolineales bacterium]|nr:hypothetical protein [Anaerolineales bacterium]